MEKNTAWAIALSTVVLVGWFAIQTIFFPVKKDADNVASSQSAEAVAEENQTSQASSDGKEIASENKPENAAAAEINEDLKEEFFVIETENAKVTFTNKGGDVIGFELKNHKDNDTGSGIEMAGNIDEANRAFSLSFGNDVLNDIFEARKLSDEKIGFIRKYSTLNSKGEKTSFNLVKTYTFSRQDYLLKMEIDVEGDENFEGLDFDGIAYTLRTAPQIGPEFNSKDRYEVREFMAYFDGKKKKTTVQPNSVKKFEKSWNWTAIGGKYFCEIIYPENSSKMKGITYSAKASLNGNTNHQIIAERSPFADKSVKDTYYIYVGPRVDKELNKYTSAEKNIWNLSGTHLNDALPTSGFLSWIEIALKWLLEIVYKLVHNWGVAIIIVTAILKFAMFPLTKKTAMGTSKMGEVQPKIQAIQAKYKNNPQKVQMETMKIYKEIGYNPMSGCLPMIFQFVILFAMYHLFNNYFEFRGASFIPGWIPDLSKGDHVKTLSFALPLLGNELRILPVIYVVSQLFYGKITQNGGTASAANQGSMKFMMYGMPLMFFFLFYNAPSGLILYWTVSNLIQLGQQLYINAKVKKAKK